MKDYFLLPNQEKKTLYSVQKFGFFCFLVFILVTCFGQFIEFQSIVLFREIHFSHFKFGEHSGRMLLLPLGVMVYLLYQKHFTWKGFTQYEKWALAYWGFLILHLIWAHFPKYARRGPEVFGYSLCCYFIVKYFLQTKKDLRKIVHTFLFATFIVGFVNLYELHVLGLKFHWGWPNKNCIASLLSLNLALSCFLFFYDKPNKFWKIFYGIFMTLAFIGILASEARSTLLAFPFSFLIVAFIYNRKILLPIILSLFLGIALLFTVYSAHSGKRMKMFFKIPRKISSLVNGSSSKEKKQKKQDVLDLSLSFRFQQLWPLAIEIISDHPFLGIGCHSFRKEVQSNKKYSSRYNLYMTKSDAHNTILQIGVSLGFFGIIVYLSFVVVVIRFLLQNLKQIKDPLYVALNLAILVWFISHFLEAMTAYYYIKERFVLLFVLIISLAIRSRALLEETSKIGKQKNYEA